MPGQWVRFGPLARLPQRRNYPFTQVLHSAVGPIGRIWALSQALASFSTSRTRWVIPPRLCDTTYAVQHTSETSSQQKHARRLRHHSYIRRDTHASRSARHRERPALLADWNNGEHGVCVMERLRRRRQGKLHVRGAEKIQSGAAPRTGVPPEPPRARKG